MIKKILEILAILTFSFDINAFYGRSETCGIEEVARGAISEGKNLIKIYK